ncbi:PepSY domain-containing protein [Bradyrhizobium diazoefficiens]|uniref:PepSY domain-containing protein n=1 Tax=Bradyrhizobium diazoefficiens TaxID=1355477 RepID=UPI00190C817E|nr:PepSY domain-containing protein [Bradyrhizobium diazoefficiens]QQO32562.1 PepSY domain-containing protein [Bradyrhizobium diazoefficiens]
MRTSTIYRTALLLALTASPAHALTQEELIAKIQAAGYSQVQDVKSTAEGITAQAVKEGKPVKLVVDSSGQIKERN